MIYLKKRYLYLMLSCFCLNKLCEAQTTFFADYALPFASGLITSTLSNNIVGVTVDPSGQNVFYYKMDEFGNMVWLKKMSFAINMVPKQIKYLSDSSFAFLCLQSSTPNLPHIFKVDLNGNLLWVKTLPFSHETMLTGLAPTTDGGLMLMGSGNSGANLIIHMNSNGLIISHHSYSSLSSSYSYPNPQDLVHDGNNQYSFFGFATTAMGFPVYKPLIFFKADSACNVYNYKEIYLPFGATNDWSGESQFIAQSSSRGHFCTFGANDTIDKNTFVLLYLDSMDQLVWFKNIATPDTMIFTTSILSTNDGGCIIAGYNIQSINPVLKYVPFAMRFDVAGTLMWSKLGGDLNQTYWNRMNLSSMTESTNSGWMANASRWGWFNICKLDSAFNGFCTTTSFTPIITNFIPAVVQYSLTSATIPVPINSISPISSNYAYSLFYECASSVNTQSYLNEFGLTVSPNPATSVLEISIEIPIPEVFEITLHSTMGRKMYYCKKQFNGSSSSQLQLDGLVNGIYFLEVKSKSTTWKRKVVVSH